MKENGNFQIERKGYLHNFCQGRRLVPFYFFPKKFHLKLKNLYWFKLEIWIWISGNSMDPSHVYEYLGVLNPPGNHSVWISGSTELPRWSHLYMNIWESKPQGNHNCYHIFMTRAERIWTFLSKKCQIVALADESGWDKE